MGWTCLHYPKGTKFIDFCREEFNSENDRVKFEVLDAALVGRTQGFVALKRTLKETNESIVFALVLAITWHNEYENMCFKEMDEEMGPYYYKCPKRILKLLSPTDNKEALKWRQKVLEYHDKKTELKKIKVGDIIEFEDFIEFNDGYRTKHFCVREKTRGYFKDGLYWMRKSLLLKRKWKIK